MSLNSHQARIQGALKDLMRRWDETKQHWNDPVSRAFEKEHLQPLEPRTRAAASAMGQMSELLSRARQECE